MTWGQWLLVIAAMSVLSFLLGKKWGLFGFWFGYSQGIRFQDAFPSMDDEIAGVCHICRRDGQDTSPTDDGTTEIMICVDCKSVPHIQHKWNGN